MTALKKIAGLILLLLSGFQLTFGQSGLASCNPSTINTRPYQGNLTITGQNTLLWNATGGYNLRLVHVGTGTSLNAGQAELALPWAPGPGWGDTTVAGQINIPGNAPVGDYNVYIDGFDQFGPSYFLTYSSLGSIFSIHLNEAFFSGYVIADTDSNCVRGPGDIGIPNAVITATPGPYYGFTDSTGRFEMNIPNGTYTFSTSPPPGSSIICPSAPFTQTGTVSISGDTLGGIDFFTKSSNLTDVTCSVLPFNHRPGFNNNIVRVVIRNTSAVQADNVELQFVKPSDIGYIGFSPINPTVVAGDTARFNLGTIPAFTDMTLVVTDSVPLNLFGSTLLFKASVSTSTPEVSINNNSNSNAASIVVTGSTDKNDKQVWTENGAIADGYIDTSDIKLKYLIRFQNTGTDTAFNIVIRDTMDMNLDLGTFTVTGASHPSYVTVDPTNANALLFNFDNILLPDSNINEPLSHGWIEYTVERKSNLTIGAAIENTAHIYFDFNAAIVTNTVSSTICPALGDQYTFLGTGFDFNFTGPTMGAATSWQWDFGDSQTGSGQQVQHTYLANGLYHVCLTVSSDCGRSEVICDSVLVNATGFGSPQTSWGHIGLAPNPANDHFKLSFHSAHIKGLDLRIRDALGREIKHWSQDKITGDFEQEIDVAALSNGMYFLELSTAQSHKMMKFVVRHE